MHYHWRSVFLCLILTGLWIINAAPTLAQEPIPENEQCLTCHSNPDPVLEFPDGTSLDAHVSNARYVNSVHGQEAMTCGGCHPDHQEYPHPELTATTAREYTRALNETCLECHPDQANLVSDSMHAVAFEEGNLEAAMCVDCHGAHDTQSKRNARTDIANTCRQCHAGIYDDYAMSAHGEALISENNVDVPTCVDCHGVHNIEPPHATEFRLKSPEMCGNCHADEALMDKYDISTDVFDTYVADFHGSTVTMFQKQSPDAAVNEAVCYDCHGIHAILPMDHPDAIANNKENLLKTCQKCHPDATTNFPDSWTSHYRPTFEDQPLVAVVNLFYLIVIPATIGGMALFVTSDAGRRIISRGAHPPLAEDDNKPDDPPPAGPAPDPSQKTSPEDAA
jgi:predicted CXXCH cytochrome family protein